MKKVMTGLVCCLFVQAGASDTLTDQLHQEVYSQTKHPINISAQSHPILYQLVVDLVGQAKVPMPRYITIFHAEKNLITNDGIMHTLFRDINPSVGVFGDLYLCYEALIELSYENVRSMIALAVSGKVNSSPFSAIMLASLGALSSIPLYNNVVHGELSIWGRSLLVAVPFFIMYQTIVNYTQPIIDKGAAHLVDTSAIVSVLKRMDELQEKYVKQGCLTRLASRLGVERLWNILTVPFRPCTFKERIDYLHNESKIEACA